MKTIARGDGFYEDGKIGSSIILMSFHATAVMNGDHGP